jgi:hypothetical protein
MKLLSSALIVLAAAIVVSGALRGTTGDREGALIIGYGVGLVGLIGWAVGFHSTSDKNE